MKYNELSEALRHSGMSKFEEAQSMVDSRSISYPTIITCANMKVIKAGDKCDHCGKEWLVTLDGNGIWHNCHTGMPIK